ncbi:alpha/beta hydrolase [Bacillus solitudinis]|uniref:alpha/beta hydrolase n=1 Tax=Bacillus solitudinis TaxID=2014074 RepID=UPI000C241385|nr:alpha/beta hydrolase-fold protein [Bacillus solitudinis]
MALIEAHFFSEMLGMEMEATLIIPQEKQPYSVDEKLRVLWLLHGGSGDNTAWSRMTSIERYAYEYGVAVILPGVHQSCFTDMAHGGKYFTYMTEELPSILKHMFPRLSMIREDNFISGLSNGGYGCLKLGLGRPDLYAAIGAFSAGDKADVEFVNDGSKRAKDRISLFGEGDLYNTKHDLKYLGRKALEEGVELPKIYHSCGSEDPWLGLNEVVRNFFQSFEDNPFQYRYVEVKGYGHAWDFWDREIIHFLQYVGLRKEDSNYIGI